MRFKIKGTNCKVEWICLVWAPRRELEVDNVFWMMEIQSDDYFLSEGHRWFLFGTIYFCVIVKIASSYCQDHLNIWIWYLAFVCSTGFELIRWLLCVLLWHGRLEVWNFSWFNIDFLNSLSLCFFFLSRPLSEWKKQRQI